MIYDLREIFGRFSAEGTFSNAVLSGSGHIHDTYLVSTRERDKDDFILQRLNNKVFKDIPSLQENIERVTGHIRSKLSAIPGSDPKRECLTLIPAADGRSWLEYTDGSFWRMFVYITDHRSYDVVDTPVKAFEGGRAIGRFQAMLADLPGKPLNETIPDFHNIEKRLIKFMASVKADSVGRVAGVSADIDAIMIRAEKMKTILRLGEQGSIPLRITHNDTKFNNILFDLNDKALCVIDLDTVMPGFVHYDFGDAIRTAANTAAEDEKDLSRISMDIKLYEAYARGYISETLDTLNTTESEYLAFAPGLITYTMAVRFLTDYLEGDVYYKIHNPEHNLQRARAQIRLVESMEDQYADMQDIINKLV